MNKIMYQASWGKLYLILGVLFGLLFILGALILKDYTVLFNLIASLVVIYFGYGMLKKPYLIYSTSEIIVYSTFGTVRHTYPILESDNLIFDNERVYLNGKKLKINSWMLEKKEWRRFHQFYDDQLGLLSELTED